MRNRTLSNCEKVWRSDYKPITGWQIMGWIICTLSMFFTIYLVMLAVTYKKEISVFFSNLIGVVFVDKALGTTVCIMLISVVAYFIYKTAKKHS